MKRFRLIMRLMAVVAVVALLSEYCIAENKGRVFRCTKDKETCEVCEDGSVTKEETYVEADSEEDALSSGDYDECLEVMPGDTVNPITGQPGVSLPAGLSYEADRARSGGTGLLTNIALRDVRFVVRQDASGVPLRVRYHDGSGEAPVIFKRIDGDWKVVDSADNETFMPLRLAWEPEGNDWSVNKPAVYARANGYEQKMLFQTLGADGATGNMTAVWGAGERLAEGQGGNQVNLSYGAGNRLESISGPKNTVYYEYDGEGRLSRIIWDRQDQAAGNKNGPQVKVFYETSRITEVWEGFPAVADPTPTTNSHYQWRVTKLLYKDRGRLTHVIRPDNYTAYLADASPTKTLESYADVQYVYYGDGQGDNSNKVKQEVLSNCGGCGGNKGGVELVYKRSSFTTTDIRPDSGLLPSGFSFTGVNAVGLEIQEKPYWDTDGDGDCEFDTNPNHWDILQYNNIASGTPDPEPTATLLERRWSYTDTANNFEVYTVRHVIVDTGGTLKKEEALYTFKKGIGGAPPANQWSLVRRTRYTFDASNYLTRVEIADKADSQTPTWHTVVENVYEDGTYGRRLLTKKQYVNGNTSGSETALETTCYYDDYNRLTEVRYPLVSENLAEAGGSAYRPTVKYRYMDTDDSRFREREDANGVITRYYYQDKDGGPGQGFGLWKEIVDYGDATHLNITTVHGYGVHGGQWLRTSVKRYLDTNPTLATDSYRETVYEYNHLGQITKVTQPGGDYSTTTYLSKTSGGLTYGSSRREYERSYEEAGETDVLLSETKYESYDAGGRPKYVTQTAAHNGTSATLTYKTERGYDPAGRLYFVKDRKIGDTQDANRNNQYRGNTVFYHYLNAKTWVTQIKQGAGSIEEGAATVVAETEYNALGQRVLTKRYVASGDSQDTAYSYDWRGRLETVDGEEKTFVRNTFDNLNRQIRVEQFDTNAQGTLLARTDNLIDAAGRTYRTLAYNPATVNDATPTTIAANYYFDKGGRLRRAENDDGKATYFEVDNAGRQTKVIDALGNETLSAYNGLGELYIQTVKHKLDATPTWRKEYTLFWYGDDGRQSVVAYCGTNTPTGFSPADPPTYSDRPSDANAYSQSTADCLVTSYTYSGLSSTVTDPKSLKTVSTSDMLGRTLQVTEKDAAENDLRIRKYAHDVWDATASQFCDTIEDGDSVAAGAQNPRYTKYWHGSTMNRDLVTKVQYPAHGVDSRHDEVLMVHRFDGSLSHRIDQRGWKTVYTYDQEGRLTQEAVTQAAGGDGYGGGTPDDLAGTTQVDYTYDALGRRTQIKDKYGAGASDVVEVNYSYAWGDGTGGFDKKHQEVQEELKVGGVTAGTLKKRVNGLGRGIRLDYPTRNGITPRAVGYEHDDLGRITSITDGVGGTEVVEYVYKGGYLQEKELGNNAVELSLGTGTGLSGYDAFGRLETLVWNDVGTGQIFKRQYAFDQDSNPTWQKDLDGSGDATARSEFYVYDGLNRLTTFKRGTPNGGGMDIDSPARQQAWTLSKEGDWDAVTTNPPAGGEPTDERTHNASHELTAVDPDGQGGASADPLTYDRAGNLWKDAPWGAASYVVYNSTVEDKNRRYTYDFRNRLLKVERQTSDSPETWQTVGEYRYDGQNRRVWRKVSNSGSLNGEWVYLYAGWRCIEERDWSGQTPANVIQKQYVWGARYLDELCRLDKSTDTDNVCDDGTYYAALNANWNVTALLNADGTVAEWYQYDPYGNVTFFTGAGTDGIWFTADDVSAATSSVGNSYLFQGQQLDAESGLYYFKNRYHSSLLGRFVQRDPIVAANLYQSLASVPYSVLDALGQSVTWKVGFQDNEYINEHWGDFKIVMDANLESIAGGKYRVTPSDINGLDQLDNARVVAKITTKQMACPGGHEGYHLVAVIQILAPDVTYTQAFKGGLSVEGQQKTEVSAKVPVEGAEIGASQGRTIGFKANVEYTWEMTRVTKGETLDSLVEIDVCPCTATGEVTKTDNGGITIWYTEKKFVGWEGERTIKGDDCTLYLEIDGHGFD